MALLNLLPLPLPPDGPPDGFVWEERDMSILSRTSAFDTGIDQRDRFQGQARCVVCGYRDMLQHCHIIRQSEPRVWANLKRRGWIPSQAKHHPSHEPRNGLLMCPNHHGSFDGYKFFIRFYPDIRKFVLVNYSDAPDLQQFHGKAIALDIRDHHAPFPSIFIIHEMRVRGFHPFQPLAPVMPADIRWQDWISSDNVFDNDSDSFRRDQLPDDGNNNVFLQSQPQVQPTTTDGGGASSGGRTAALNADVIADILAATRAMPSWRACEMEGTSWTGSAEENIQKYVSTFGIQGPSAPVH